MSATAKPPRKRINYCREESEVEIYRSKAGDSDGDEAI
jgi:hypothetical protein